MSKVGTQLKQAREAQQKSRAEVARETGILIHHLSALEHGSWDTLPDDETVAGFVRTYAEYLGFRPEEPVAEFWAERGKEPPAPEPAPAPAGSVAERRRGLPWGWIVVGVAIVVLIVGVFATRDGSEPAATPPAATPAPAPEPEPIADESVREGDVESEPAPVPSASGLRVTDHGVGTGVEDRSLIGEANRFALGRRVWFWTRVQGGGKGDRILHVWIHDGREISSVELKVGSSNWRTQSAKTLFDGSVGDWAVEARDAAGHVLARSEFVCEP